MTGQADPKAAAALVDTHTEHLSALFDPGGVLLLDLFESVPKLILLVEVISRLREVSRGGFVNHEAVAQGHLSC